MREKAIWLTEGVTLSGALRGGTVCGHTLESAILAAEGVRSKSLRQKDRAKNA